MSYLALLFHELAHDRLRLSHLSHGEGANLFSQEEGLLTLGIRSQAKVNPPTPLHFRDTRKVIVVVDHTIHCFSFTLVDDMRVADHVSAKIRGCFRQIDAYLVETHDVWHGGKNENSIELVAERRHDLNNLLGKLLHEDERADEDVGRFHVSLEGREGLRIAELLQQITNRLNAHVLLGNTKKESVR